MQHSAEPCEDYDFEGSEKDGHHHDSMAKHSRNHFYTNTIYDFSQV